MNNPFYTTESLSRNDIHIWTVRLKDYEELLSEYHMILSAEEISRAFRFISESSKKQFMLGRIKLRFILSRYAGTAPSKLNFSYKTYGKPILDGYPDIRFNLAKVEDFILIAVAKNRDLGVDLERISNIDFSSIANRYFSEDENNALKKLEESEKRNAFFRIWTLKEACVKALGVGLSYPLQSFSVSLVSGGGDALVFDRSRAAAKTFWSAMELTSPKGYCAALVAADRDWKCIYRTL